MQKGVIVYLVKRNKEKSVASVCLGMKKVRYAKGKWNGFGGKVKKRETFKEAAKREVYEEALVTVKTNNLTKMAELTYAEPAGGWVVCVFICNNWEGDPRETEEMKPKWFSVDEIPYGQMWENDKLWIERILKGEKLKGNIVNDDEDRVVKHSLIKAADLD